MDGRSKKGVLLMNIEKKARKIEKHYKYRGVPLKLVKYEIIGNGERIIYTIKFTTRTKEKSIFEQASDIKRALELALFQPFEEDGKIKLAVSKRPLAENSLQKMLENPDFHKHERSIPIAIGYDMRGEMRFADFVKFPHALYGGATLSGKTVGLRCLIASIAYKQSVNAVNIIIIDTGANGLDCFNSLPHLSCSLVKDEDNAVKVLQFLVREGKRRIALPTDELRLLPALICIVDEYLSLIQELKGKKKDELITAISSLLQKGRHSKIHMVLATQETTKKEMLLSRTNLNARMAYTVSDIHNSISILGEKGAENLPGNGAMLFKSPENPKPVYLQGAYISDDEIEQLITHITSQSHDLSQKFVITDTDLESSQLPIWTPEVSNQKPSEDEVKKELVRIIMWILGRKEISAKQLMERFNMGKRAYDIIKDLSQMKLISGQYFNQPRAVIPKTIEDITPEVMELLLKSGISEDDITTVIKNRN